MLDLDPIVSHHLFLSILRHLSPIIFITTSRNSYYNPYLMDVKILNLIAVETQSPSHSPLFSTSSGSLLEFSP